MRNGRILVVGPDSERRRQLETCIQERGHEVLLGEAVPMTWFELESNGAAIVVAADQSSGIAACDGLAGLTDREPPPCIVIADAGEDDILELFERGAADVLCSPFSPAELLAKIDRALAVAPTSNPQLDLGQAPSRIGPYVVEDLLGRQAAETRMRVHHSRKPDRPLIMRAVPLAELDRETTERVERELTRLRSFRHPSLSGVCGAGRTREWLWFVLESLEGSSLIEHVESHGAMSTRKVLRLLRQVGEALEVLHREKLIHGAISPWTVWLLEDGTIRVEPIGPLDRRGTSTRSDGLQLSLLCYLAPEMLRGLPASFRSDLFALGMVAQFALRGQSPFGEAKADVVARRILRSDLPRATEIQHISAELADVLDRLTDPTPLRRFSSAADLVETLQPLHTRRRSDSSGRWVTMA